jgi:hypothetical protein
VVSPQKIDPSGSIFSKAMVVKFGLLCALPISMVRTGGYPRTSKYSRARDISWVCEPMFDGSACVCLPVAVQVAIFEKLDEDGLEGQCPVEDLPGARKWFDSRDVGEAEATAVGREYIELSNAAANAGSDDAVPIKRSEVATRTEELLEQLRRCVVTDYVSCD